MQKRFILSFFEAHAHLGHSLLLGIHCCAALCRVVGAGVEFSSRLVIRGSSYIGFHFCAWH